VSLARIATALGGLVGLAALIAAGARSPRPACVGYLDMAAIAGGDPVLRRDSDREAYGLLYEAAAANPVAYTSVLRSQKTGSRGETSVDTEWTLGPFTLHERGNADHPASKSSVSVELTGSCDGRTIEHDSGHFSDVWQARFDPCKPVWYVVSVDSTGTLTRVTPLRILVVPRSSAVPPSPFFVFAAIAAVLATLAALRARRHAGRAAWSEVTVDGGGIALLAEGVRVKLMPPPPAHATVLCSSPPRAGAAGYREAYVLRAADWHVSSRVEERRRFRRAAFWATAALMMSLGSSLIELTAR
jgi:hypothetical protein